jgi:hypothetical protein
MTFSFAFVVNYGYRVHLKITFTALDERAEREQHRAKPFLVTDEEEHHFYIIQKRWESGLRKSAPTI